MGCFPSKRALILVEEDRMNHPNTTKQTLRGGKLPLLQFGASACQGWRPNMEDAHICSINLGGLPGHALFCVLDGHGGVDASRFAQEEFLDLFLNCEEWATYTQLVVNGNSTSTSSSSSSSNSKKTTPRLEKALVRSFVELDRELYLQNYYGEEPGASSAGSTAVAVLLTPNTIFCANLGDSRCVLGRSSSGAPTSVTPLPLSQDHKPELPPEERRIQAAGGTVIRIDGEGRIDGELAVARALGDFEFKELAGLLLDDYDPTEESDVEQLLQRAQKQKVSAYPEVQVHQREDSTDRFLVLACDGVWDVASNEDCVEWIAGILQQGQRDLGIVCEQVLDICLQQGSQDNMTIIVVLLEGGGRLIGRQK